MIHLQQAEESSLEIEGVKLVLSNQMHCGKLKMRDFGRPSDGFIWVYEGKTRYDFSTGESSFTAEPNQLFYLARGSRYAMDVQEEPYRFVFVDFDFARRGKELFASENFPVRNPQELENLMLRLERCWIRKRSGFQLECLSVLYEICARLLQQKELQYVNPQNRHMMENAISYLTSHFTESELSMAELAHTAGVSDAYFRKLFRETYDTAPLQFLMQLRIGQAKNLLKYHEQSITEIAARCGYANVYYFSRVFRQATGMSPSEYARKNRLSE